MDTTQAKTHMKLSCSNHIEERTMTSHGLEPSSSEDNPNTASPLQMNVLDQLSKHTDGPKEGAQEHQTPQDQHGFSCRTLPGKTMFACVSCRPDIGCAITLMSKHGLNPLAFHHCCLKSIANYLRAAEEWGITFHRNGAMDLPPDTPMPDIPSTDHSLPAHPKDNKEPKLTCFADAACGNNPTKMRCFADMCHHP